MLSPSLPSPEERGKRWLQAQVQQILAAHAVPLGTRAEGDPVYWGKARPRRHSTSSLASDPEPKALPFHRATIMSCGTGLYVTQSNATMLIRRALKKMGILPT